MSSYQSPRAWDPQAVKHAIDLQLDYDAPESQSAEAAEALRRMGSEALARNKAREAAPVAMDAIIHLATYAENESLRFKAASYIVDRVLGRITDVPMDASAINEDDPLTKLVKSSLITPTAAAN